MAYGDRNPGSGNVVPFRRFPATRWHDKAIPPRRWLVDGILARGSITLLTGDGGIGKSLLAQQLQTALALGGERWAGIALPADPIVSFGIYCEDDEDELHRRQADINEAYNVGMNDLGGVHYTSRVGEDSTLAYFGRDDQIKATPFHEQVSNAIHEVGAQLVIIDTAADTFGGNENVRIHVRSFINLLRRWPMGNDGGLILTAHPSNFGVTQGTGISGSTAWNNSVRGRVYLTKPKDDVEQYGETEDTNERVLKIMKSNYGPAGKQIRLRWEHGAFAPVATGGPTMMDKLELDDLFLRELGNLMADGVRVLATDSRSPRNFVSLLTGRAALKRYTGTDLRAAKERLDENGRLVKVQLGPKSRPDTLIRPADLRYPGENS